MDIGSRNGFPAGNLSNFSNHEFVIDGIRCASMEGFLQSLKFSGIETQIYVCGLVGYRAKKAGKNQPWWETQKLWWKGKEINRHSKEYQDLLDMAYDELSKNKLFRKALIATGNEVLTHSIGRNDPRQTILTEKEFCSRLMTIRGYIATEDK